MPEPADAKHRDEVAGNGPVRRSALNVVTPAQPIGAASAKDSSSGMRASAVAGTIDRFGVTAWIVPAGHLQR